VVRLEGGSLPVGLLPEVVYDQMQVSLRPGDLLVVVSDGMVEVRNQEEEFWEEQEVERIVEGFAGGPLGGLSDELCRAAEVFANGAQQYDDMTLVAVRIGQATT
jgi:serine phosphatase RsbU (regulator of sigma subunit)